MRDIITVFNQLTQSELTDSSLFEDVLDNHYEKFKYFYHCLQFIKIEAVSKITCCTDTKKLDILVEAVNADYLDEIDNAVDVYMIPSSAYRFAKCFIVTVSYRSDKILNISIETTGTISREDEIYEARFNPN